MYVHPSCAVEGEISAYCETEGFDGFYLVPVLTSFPHLYQRLLHDVLGISIVESDALRQPEELVLQRQDIVAKAYFIHSLY